MGGRLKITWKFTELDKEGMEDNGEKHGWAESKTELILGI